MAIPDVTGGAAAKERYIFPTITVPPTSVAQQAGISIGYPVPADTNRSATRLIATGKVRQTTGNTPSVAVKISDLGVATRPGRGVPRIVVQRSNGLGITDGANWAKLTRDFALMEEISIDLGAGDPWTLVNAPVMMVDDDGTFRLIAGVWPANGGTGFTHQVLVKSFDPATDAGWQTFLSSALSSYVTMQGDETAISLCTLSAAHKRGSGIYLLLGLYGTTATGQFSRLHSIVLTGTTAAAAALVEIGASVNFESGYYGSNHALAFLGDGDALAAVNLIRVADGTSSVVLARSPDMRTWGSIGSTAIFPTFTRLASVTVGPSVTSRGRTVSGQGAYTDIAFGDGDHGWATTGRGEIFRTADGGQSWSTCTLPQPDPRSATFGLEAVSAALVSGSTYAVYVVGWLLAQGHRSGLMLRSVDNGETWKVLVGTGIESYYDTTDFAFAADANTLAMLPFHAVTFTTAAKGWAVGDKSQILYTADGGQTWTRVRTLNDAAGAHLYAVVADSVDNIMVAGDPQEAGQIINAGPRKARAILIAGATAAVDPNSAANTYLREIATDDAAPIVSLSQPTTVALTNAASIVYGLTRDGILHRWNGSTAGWTQRAIFAPRLNAYTRVVSPVGSPATAYVLGPSSSSMGAGGRSVLWRSGNATATAPVFTPASSESGLRALWCVDVNNGYVGGDGLFRFGTAADERMLPALLVTPTGAVIMPVVNYTLGLLEIYRAPDSRLEFELVDTGLGAVAQPSLTQADNGDILLACGTTGRVTTDDGRTWVDRQDASLSLPLGTLPATADYTQPYIDMHRTIAALGGGRLFAATSKLNASKLGVFVARDWASGGTLTGTTTANASTTITGSGTSFTTEIAIGQCIALSSAPTTYATVLAIASNTSLTVSVAMGDGSSQTISRATGVDPMPILSKPQWLGLDDLRGQFAGHPAIGDQWTIAPRYNYQAANLMMYDSPSVQWRSTGVDTELILLWDRQAAATVAVLGVGQFWDVCAFALFGSNARQVYFEVSNPANDAQFTSYLSSLSVGSGKCVGLKTTGACNVLVCTLANGTTAQSWTPGQFNPWSPEPMPGRRQYYIRIASSPESAYRIRRSTPSELVIEANAAGLPTIATNTDFTIFGDRHAWWGEGGSGPGSAGLRDSTYRYGRYVRVRIPAQPTAEGHFAVGTPIFGTEPYPDTEGRSFAYGFTWNPVTNTTQERGLSGVTSVETHGGTGNVWALAYAAEKRDAVMRRLHPMVDQMRKLFAIAIRGNDVDTIELVRLTDAQRYQNLIGDRYSAPWVLEEVP